MDGELVQVTDDEAELQGGDLGCVPALDGQGLLDEGVVDEAVSEVRSILESEVGVAVEHSRGCAEANIRACLPGWE